jgi:hypothetical protein
MTVIEQIKVAQRELAMRKRLYPRWVAEGRMDQAKAAHEIEGMTAIVNTLQTMQLIIEEQPPP